LLAIRKDTQFKETTLKSDDFIDKSLRIVSLNGEIVTKTVVKARPQNNKCPQNKKGVVIQKIGWSFALL
jgi:hypothetical protein